MENYISDKTVSSKDEDQFQRYDYAKRIADTISTRNSTDNIVFGLYGKWGEGKSSVLKFIENELDKKKTLQVHFNPWRYNDEDSILLSFFEEIAKALNKELKSNNDKAKEAVKKYGFITKVFGVDISGFSNLFSDVDVEHFKAKTEEILKESEKKLIVFIDDIDRLDKEELFTLFRLIKLTADFSNTIYILSFDKEMVAKAIGQRFGNGDQKDGSSFLEKIVQIPIELPRFRYSELLEYTLGLINEVLIQNEVVINESEQERFRTILNDCLYEAIKTPRDVIRYRNALEFSLPLMKGEVNLVDFMIFEGFKLFYKEHVEFIKAHPEIFLFNYVRKNMILHEINEVNKEETKEKIEKIHNSLTDTAREGMRSALLDLFPKIQKYYSKNHAFSNDQIDKNRSEQRIGSADYFERYLSYSVAKDEISDKEFSSFIASLDKDSIESINKESKKFIDGVSMREFLNKLNLLEKKFGWEQSKKIIELLFINSELLEEEEVSFFDYNSTIRQSTYFITRLLKKTAESSNALDFLTEKIKLISNYQFLLKFLKMGIFDKNNSEDLFETEEIKIIYETSIDHILNDLNEGDYIFDRFPDFSNDILFFWVKIDLEEARNHTLSFLNSKQEAVIRFLESLVGLAYINTMNGESTHTSTFRADLREEEYKFIKNMGCHKEVNKQTYKLYTKKEIADHELILDSRGRSRQENTELNLAKQFLHFYEKDKSN